jgi:fucose permease
VILFFTCAGAAIGPLAMGAFSDIFGGLRAGFALATAFAVILFIGLLYNWIANPTRAVLSHLDETEYATLEQTTATLS